MAFFTFRFVRHSDQHSSSSYSCVVRPVEFGELLISGTEHLKSRGKLMTGKKFFANNVRDDILVKATAYVAKLHQGKWFTDSERDDCTRVLRAVWYAQPEVQEALQRVGDKLRAMEDRSTDSGSYLRLSPVAQGDHAPKWMIAREVNRKVPQEHSHTTSPTPAGYDSGYDPYADLVMQQPSSLKWELVPYAWYDPSDESSSYVVYPDENQDHPDNGVTV